MPKISVILPTYNRQHLLAEALMSILNQTVQDIELIVADDGSTDGTAQVVEGIRQRDARVIYLPLPHAGRSRARNKAFEIARGAFIAFQDSDDISLPNRLEAQLSVLQSNPEVGMVYCSTLYMDTEGNLLDDHYIVKPVDDLYQAIIRMNYRAIIPMTAMIHTEVLTEVGGFDENLDRFEDLDFILRIAQRFPSHAVTEPLVKARLHDDNAMPSQQPQEVLRNLNFFSGKVLKNDNGRTPPGLLKSGLARLYLIYGNETSKFFPFKFCLPFYRNAFSLAPHPKQAVWFFMAAAGLLRPFEKLLRRRKKSGV